MDTNFNIVVFCSGTGSNLKAINNSINKNILKANLIMVIIDNENAPCINYCEENNITYEVVTWDKSIITRSEYYDDIRNILLNYNINLIVCAGWMNIISSDFLKSYNNIINIHPALPNSYIGAHCIRQAYNDFCYGKIKHSGVMIHKVSEELDRGETLKTVNVPMYDNDSYESFETRMKSYEKGILISTINDYILQNNKNIIEQSNNKKYIGKVRCVENINFGLLLLTASNRISAFDKFLTNINHKGIILNNLSKFWFNKTKHIIENHYLHSEGPYMVVKKTEPIKLEIVVRGYMTGSSNTSIWTKYKSGERNIYGYNFRDNYRKNEILDEILVTPTTKGVVDVPITKEEIINEGYLSVEEVDFIYEKALQLFKFGQEYASKRNLILVDTKYEFGKIDNKIILIDELHTCDSSRYWVKNSYLENFNSNLEPVKLDKDAIRDWVKTQCDPYKDTIPKIPDDVKNQVEAVYISFYEKLTQQKYDHNSGIVHRDLFLANYFENIHKNIVVIFGGSVSDMNHLNNIQKKLKEVNIYGVIHVCSAHKNTRKLLTIMDKYENFTNRNVIYVTCAGMSNALSGVVACNSRYPVFACPPFSDKSDMMVNINSTLQMPSKVPVMITLSPTNIALAIQRLFRINLF